MPADAAGHSENADEADLLNSESEHSEEEELNPDDFSEDVSRNICCTVFLHLCGAVQGHQQPASLSKSAVLFVPKYCAAGISPVVHLYDNYLARTQAHMYDLTT